MKTAQNTMVDSMVKKFIKNEISKIEAVQEIKKYYGFKNLMAAKKHFDKSFQTIFDNMISDEI